MEFEDEDREDEQEEEDDDYDDEDEGITIPPPSITQTQTYDSSSAPNIFTTNHRKVGDPAASTTTSTGIRYRECLKNHAVNIGGHAVDGCGEFMPAGGDGTLEALKCAACGCHRNFHRKEHSLDFLNSSPTSSNPPLYPQFTPSPYYRAQPQPFQVVPPPPPPHMSAGHHQHHYHRALALPSTSGGYGTSRSGDQEMDEMSNPSSSGGGGGSMGKSKRFRTKFTQEQKDRMFEFAEKVGWRIQKHDEAAVQQFCQDVGVRRQVLKVWMHNNKNTLGSGRKNPVFMG